MTLDSQTLAWLTDALLQSSVLLALALIVNLLLKRHSAAKRHALLLLTSLGIPLLLVFSAILPQKKIELGNGFSNTFPIETHFTQTFELGAPITSAMPSSSSPEAVSNSPLSSEQTTTPLSSWMIGIWLTGVIILWLRLALGIIFLSRINKLSSAPPTHIITILNEELQSLDLRSSPKVITLKDQTMPMTWQLGSHTLALPESAATWPPEKLRHVIRHELAHIKRRDCLFSWLSQLSLALVWFNPLALIQRRALEATREAACDDLALRDPSDQQGREAYARDLLDIITTHTKKSRHASLALAMARRTNGIRQRLGSILDSDRNRATLSSRFKYFITPLCLASIATLASLSACRTPAPTPKPATSPTTVTATSQVKISAIVIELDKPDKLRKLFNIEKSDIQFTGIITHDRMTALMAEFQSDPNADLLTSLSVVTPLKKTGKIEQIREFIYPTEYDAPQIPKPSSIVGEHSGSTFPVTPATPTSFETKNLGVTLEITPRHAGDNVIDLGFSLQHTHFLGFVNYGSPITAPATNFFGFPVEIVITENRIEMPVFRSNRFKSNVMVLPGQVIVLVGLAQDTDPNLAKRLHSPHKPLGSDLGTPKHTVYFIYPEFVEED